MVAWLDVGEGRVRRLWRSLGPHQPRKLPRRLRSGCDMRLPGAVRPNSVWSYDFVHEQFVNSRGVSRSWACNLRCCERIQPSFEAKKRRIVSIGMPCGAATRTLPEGGITLRCTC